MGGTQHINKFFFFPSLMMCAIDNYDKILCVQENGSWTKIQIQIVRHLRNMKKKRGLHGRRQRKTRKKIWGLYQEFSETCQPNNKTFRHRRNQTKTCCSGLATWLSSRHGRPGLDSWTWCPVWRQPETVWQWRCAVQALVPVRQAAGRDCCELAALARGRRPMRSR